MIIQLTPKRPYLLMGQGGEAREASRFERTSLEMRSFMGSQVTTWAGWLSSETSGLCRRRWDGAVQRFLIKSLLQNPFTEVVRLFWTAPIVNL